MTQEVKVKSLWKNRNGETVEVLAVHDDVAFVKIGSHALSCEIKSIRKNCTPYTPPRRCEGWVNVYETENGLKFGGTVYLSKSIAEAYQDNDYLTTIKIEYEEPQE